MHRSTPADTLRRAYDSGGCRTCIDKVDDSRMMQEMAGNFMKGESRKALEAAQNYGFSSVVMPATKGSDGQIQECAEGFISFLGGNRSFPVCTVMDDRRHRPMQLPPGASAQYGPNTDYGRALTLIKPTPQDQGSSGGSSGGGGSTRDSSGGGSSSSGEYGAFMVVPHPQEYASMRHINNKKQPRPQGAMGTQQGGGGGGQSQQGDQQQQYNHEKGDSINTEMRCTNSRIEFRSGDTVVGYYDKSASKWAFIGEVHLGVESASHRVYGVNGDVGMTTASSGSGAVLVNATQPGPPTSLDNQPYVLAMEQRFEARIAELEARLAALGG
jgi:hypothetical protein